MNAYKVLTHDYRPPVQGGEPVWDGETLPWDARAARDAWAARAAWAALTVEYAAPQEWTKDDPLLLTTGIRDAYLLGLGIALPTGPNELGWAMDDA